MAETRRLKVGLMPSSPESMLSTRTAKKPDLRSKSLEPDLEKIGKPMRNTKSKVAKKFVVTAMAATLTFGSLIAPLAQTAPPKGKPGIELALNKKPDKPVVELAQNTTPAKKLSPEQGSGVQTQADNSVPSVTVREFQDAIDTNQKMVGKREVVAGNFTKNTMDVIKLEEWTVHTVGADGKSGTDIYNSLVNVAEGTQGSKSIFLTDSIQELAAKLGVIDRELVAGPFAIRNPNDPSQTVLALATRDWLVFYALNTKKDQKGEEVKTVEMFANPLKELSIAKKPMVIFETGFDEKSGWINAIVTDENWVEKIRKGEKVKFAMITLYPDENKPGVSKVRKTDIFEIVP